MSFLGQSRRLLMRSVGFGQVVDQRDAYLASASRRSASATIQRAARRGQVRREAKPRPTAPTVTRCATLRAGSIPSSSLPCAIFFHAVDGAREAFLRRRPKLDDQLLAVKLINLLTAKHEYLWGAIATTARPIGFMLDPANQCHLGCPSCTNSYNRAVSEQTFNPWPRGLMTVETFDAFLEGDRTIRAFSATFTTTTSRC